MRRITWRPNITNMPGRAFLWTKAQGIRDLGTLGGPGSVAYAISNSAQVVGQADVEGFGHAFLWTESGGMQDLGTLGGGHSGAFAINNKGEVVGYSDTGIKFNHAFLWTKATGMQDLYALGFIGLVSGINDNSRIVGSAIAADPLFSPTSCLSCLSNRVKVEESFPERRSAARAWSV